MSGYKTHRLSQEPDDFDGPWPEENAMTTEWKVVPIEPTAEQSDELARDIIMWWSMSPPTGDALYRHLKRLGRDVPPWLPTMIRDAMYVPPKGVVTMVIYRAMLDAAPAAPTPLDSSVIREGMRQLELRRERLAEIKERIAGLGQEQGEPEPVSFLDQVRENMEAMGAALGQLTEQEKRAPARREEMAAFAAELKADPAKAQRFFQEAGILDAGGNLTPQYGGPVIDTADHVFHEPTGETWVVKYVRGDKLAWCGWPEGEASLSHCTLVKKATSEERARLIAELPDAVRELLTDQKSLPPELDAKMAERWHELYETTCPTCGSDCNERDELEKAEREIERLRAAPQQAEPVAWRDHVEQRLHNWRQRTMNRSGDRLALDDMMSKESIDDLIDYVCDEWSDPVAPQQAEPVAQIGWADEFGNLFPMGAWKPAQRTHHDSHKAAWRPVFLHPPAAEVQTVPEVIRNADGNYVIKGSPPAGPLLDELLAQCELKAEVQRLRDALENVRLLAARHRTEEWANHMLRFCADVGVKGSPLREGGK